MSEPQRIAFASPRFADGNTIGGAETLLKSLAMDARRLGYSVDFLATCASNHFTWANEIPPGKREIDGINVHNFPVDDRDAGLFLQLQQSINKGKKLSDADQERWMSNSVNSSALYQHLKANDYHRVITGPYLFGLAQRVAALDPTRTVLVPCLHDEAFAYQDILKPMFTDSRTIIFNTQWTNKKTSSHPVVYFYATYSQKTSWGLSRLPPIRMLLRRDTACRIPMSFTAVGAKH